MEQFVGLDVSQQMTHVCIIGSDGKTVWQGKCLSTPEAIAEVIKSKAPEVARIGCGFRRKATTESDGKRPLIPTQGDHRFRGKPGSPEVG